MYEWDVWTDKRGPLPSASRETLAENQGARVPFEVLEQVPEPAGNKADYAWKRLEIALMRGGYLRQDGSPSREPRRNPSASKHRKA